MKKMISLKALHLLIIAFSIIVAAFIILFGMGDWLTWAMIAFTAITADEAEPDDELSNHNILKANTFTMWMLIVTLAILYLFTAAHERQIPKELFVILLSGAVILRSTAFLVYDRTPRDSEEDE